VLSAEATTEALEETVSECKKAIANQESYYETKQAGGYLIKIEVMRISKKNPPA